MGFWRSLQYYGHLMNEMLRANRLVIDTGIHAMGWSTEQGIAWMMDHSSMNRAQAAAEVERYVAYPAQALSTRSGSSTSQRFGPRQKRSSGRDSMYDNFTIRFCSAAACRSPCSTGSGRWIARIDATR